MRCLCKVTSFLLVIAHLCRSEDPAVKSDLQDNILKKFLEGVIDDDEHAQFAAVNKASKTQSSSQKLPVPKKKTIILANVGAVGQPESNASSLTKQKTNRSRKHTEKIEGPGGTVLDKTGTKTTGTEDQTSKPEIQPELTFETPTSAAFLLKPLSTKMDISLEENEIKEIKTGLKTLENLAKELEGVRSTFSRIFKSLYEAEKDGKESKQVTDSLNYNFIEVTEARPSGKVN